MSRLFGPAFVAMGVLHWVRPEPFDALIPAVLPGSARAWTRGSGVVEIATGAAIVYPPTRRAGGGIAAGLLLGLWVGNVTMAWRWRHKSWPWQIVSIGRLPIQVPLIATALRIAQGRDDLT